MNAYQAKRAAKLERYRTYAENAAARSEAAYERSHDILDIIPPGQPILVGHHSEKGHRSALAKADNAMRRTLKESKKAQYWTRRADAVESDTGIRREDPEAVAKLKEKIVELEAEQARRKYINAQIRKGVNLNDLELTPREVGDLEMAARFNGVKGYPSYAISNANGNLRRYRQRLAELED